MTTPLGPEDPELKLAQINKLHAETEKLKAEKLKLEQEAAAVPRQARGSYWSEVIKILCAIVLGIGGVVTAGGSYFVARNQVELAEIKSSQADEKARAAESVAVRAKAEAAAAVNLRDTARREEAEAAKSVKELRDSLAELTSKVQSENPGLLKRQLVYIQFQGDLSRALINELRQSLEAKGLSAPGAERLAAPYKNLVKYFRPEEEKSAALLAKATEEFFMSKGCSVKLRAVEAKTEVAAPPLELWLSHSCKQ
ncbi:hypothetical protein [Pseudomonas japonica]|uniref:Uncharacterized protein n=1 Tax=Pseudomonas japonica TaxID=256466 RepID=A0A239KKZ5_9PSED|nr:hypothetical protein [Pseudomonas japonica]SNT18269.1 hypothetical protein SAMN05444352_12743 [Pseudomonas japonica]